ncbi:MULTISPECIES: manganese-dependent inorganic pyrophosphatase [unclassified Exiguobacterium]|uniref:manganese-dependent inorganic pyrophosphatase n=1 Tax=unclassified Exiguobacterium TaxID=2644629 RepID=UPI001038A3AC|nr:MULTISPECIES: manganese-dependent inorganic pyrophosphatase [unclassified Exiguobacterium]TCI34548.1 manganese-dependent inorganic pyrophosphatase [Exiguobacterium sp. SH4S7]TCI44301.1 manganese-dependent inorganic pyrophosphatase [Exiguobacterium sp. SH5S32]TCI50565.1 manganese-dependent inorganic pyrophosphatase [Exiguobacterium sp. SH1S4]TCI60621.1 manganese-dependent inorganic pyrophosphatase [Exiguobacterium sp. SH0S2]TCI69525.1 manganese-dependent inorganic pyrophosphatase [Exiguobact
MSTVLVFGHKNPDTDTICSALAYAELKKKLGMDAEAVRLGEVNGETQYALDHFRVKAPRLVERVSDETSSVILVDHNEFQQSAPDIADVRILEVVDHHRIANFQTADALYYRAEPVGCTATILLKLYKEHGVEIASDMAGLMLSAIISDSLLFKSPTCTDEDVKAAKELADIAGTDVEAYGLEMLKAGADLSQKTVPELISLDAKEFAMGDYRIEIAQVNTVDANDVLSRKSEVEAAMAKTIADKQLDLFVFAITNILTNDSEALVVGAKHDLFEQAFNVELLDGLATLPGVVSRKKQIVPVLTAAATN